MKILTSYIPYIKKLELLYLRCAKIISSVPSNYYFILVFVTGSVIRLRQYFTSRSFWLDEAALAVNIRDRDYSQLLEPLEYSQVAPIGFLYLEKYMTTTFGQGELIYRLIPILAGIGSIWLIYKLFSSSINKEVALISTIIFIFSTTLTYFSSELKQYSSDIFFVLLIFGLWNKFSNNRTIVNSLLVGLVGAVGIWFSNVLIIAFASIGVAELVRLLFNGRVKRFQDSTPAYFLWILSFGIYYYYFILDHPHNEGMKEYWADKFLTTNSLLETGEWIFNALKTTFSKSIGFYESFRVPLFIFFLGIIISFLNNRKNLVFLLPIVIHFILSGLKLYPYDNRLILYLLPFYIVFVAIAIDYISKLYFLRRVNVLISILLLYSVTGLYFHKAKDYFITPYMREHIKPTLIHIKKNMEKDDIIYVYYGSLRAFRFYEPMINFSNSHIVMGKYPNALDEKFTKELSELDGRVWILFSHMWPPDGIEYIENKIIKENVIDYYETDGSKTFLLSIEK